MGGGNLQKSQMARERNQAKMGKEGAGGGGTDGMAKRHATADVFVNAQAERAAAKAAQEATRAMKNEKAAAAERKLDKINKAAGGGGGAVDDAAAAKAKKAKMAAAAAAAAGGAAPKPKAKKAEAAATAPAAEEAAEEEVEEAAAPESLASMVTGQDAPRIKGAAEAAELFEAKPLSPEERAVLDKAAAARNTKQAELDAREGAKKVAADDALVKAAISKGEIKGITADEFDLLRSAAASLSL